LDNDKTFFFPKGITKLWVGYGNALTIRKFTCAFSSKGSWSQLQRPDGELPSQPQGCRRVPGDDWWHWKLSDV